MGTRRVHPINSQRSEVFGTYEMELTKRVHDANAKLRTRQLRLTESVDRVVIGEGDGEEARVMRSTNNIGRRARSVRCRGVHVEIDERRRPGRRGHGA